MLLRASMPSFRTCELSYAFIRQSDLAASYLYGTTDTAEYQHHLLMDPMLIPHLVLPYIDMVVLEANFLSEDEVGAL